MSPDAACRVLLVRAIEQNDPGGVILPVDERERAGLQAGPPESVEGRQGTALTADETEFVVRRAQILAPRVEREYPAVRRAERFASMPGWVTALVCMIALIAGFGTNALGPERRINILSVPLLGLLAWNAVIYIILMLGAVRSLRASRAEHAGAMPGLVAQWFMRITGTGDALQSGTATDDPAARAISDFAAQWARACGPVYARQAEVMLHLGAALLALGAVGGMYLRGLAFEYLAGWESTFLDAGAVHGLLQAVLGPASMLSGSAIPGVERISELNWGAGGAGENAAPWIHLYAITAAVAVGVPRLLLACAAGLAVRRARCSFFIPQASDPYFRKLLGAGRGGGEVVRVLPYSVRTDPALRESVRAFLHDLWGGRVQVDFQEPVDYGAEDDFLAEAAVGTWDPAEYVVILMNLASTPEEENHGVFVRGVAERVAQGRIGRRLLVVLDASSYRERPGFHQRIEERVGTWRRMLEPQGLAVAVLGDETAGVEVARRAVWSPA